MRWVYSIFLASLTVLACIEKIFWFSQQNRLFLQVSFEAGNKTSKESWFVLGAIFSANGDDKLANVFIQLDG